MYKMFLNFPGCFKKNCNKAVEEKLILLCLEKIPILFRHVPTCFDMFLLRNVSQGYF